MKAEIAGVTHSEFYRIRSFVFNAIADINVARRRRLAHQLSAEMACLMGLSAESRKYRILMSKLA